MGRLAQSAWIISVFAVLASALLPGAAAATAVAQARTALESLGRDLPRAERWLREASESLISARTEGPPDQAARSAMLAESSRRLRLACRAQVRAAQVTALVGRITG